MKIILLDAVTFGDTDLSGFDELGKVSIYQMTAPDELDERIADADVIVTNKVVITADTMQKSKNLKLICIAATGMNNVDLKAAKERGIEVRNVAGYSTDSVVQHTFSMLFYLIGHSRYYDESVKSGAWSRSGIFTDVSRPFFEISGKKWGIIGLGTIGRKVALLAKAFGADVSYFSTSGKNLDSEFKSVELDELLRQSDIITIHAPLNEMTANLLDYEKMLGCKEGVVILNLGRGGIINEADAAKIIDERKISLGLDVLSREPIEEGHPLLHVKNKDNLYITPHIAWTSKEARDTLIASTIENIRSL
ncbi:D-2-hydroxyacid dehydrogenase [Sulfurimonas sp. HSL-1716]|uniref:D-2-hydroxyacid dehydrogenase n=1 Tax=Hydrocurvibacter sulfurireducens TaxID=3131937 RepID=UPI0031F99827